MDKVQKIELVAEALDHRATQIAGIRQRVIVKSFVEKRKGTVLWLERRQMHFRIVNAVERYRFRGDLRHRFFGTSSGSFGRNVDLLGAAKRSGQNSLNRNGVAACLRGARYAFAECKVSRRSTIRAIAWREAANRPDCIGRRRSAGGLIGGRVRVKIDAIANPCDACISCRQHGTRRFKLGLQQKIANNRKP